MSTTIQARLLSNRHIGRVVAIADPSDKNKTTYTGWLVSFTTSYSVTWVNVQMTSNWTQTLILSSTDTIDIIK